MLIISKVFNTSKQQKMVACGGNVNYYKSVHNPIPTLPVGTNTRAIFKTNDSPFN